MLTATCRCLEFGLDLHLHVQLLLYFVYANEAGSDETVYKRSLIRAFRTRPAWDTEIAFDVRASQASMRCVLEQNTLIIAKYWLNPGRPVPL